LREQPPTPESLGLNPQAHLQLLTEFTGSPDPAQKAAARDRQDNLQDSTMTFGAMTMVQGKAFSVGSSGSHSAQNNQSRLTSAATGGTPTYKSWMHLQGRTFLVEEVSYQRLATQLQQLPTTSRLDTADTNLLAANSILGRVSPQRLLPPEVSKSEIGNRKSEMIQLARADVFQKPGVVLDYEAVDSEDSYTFQSGETYYVSGPVTITSLTIQGGAIIKYDNNTSSAVNVLGTIYGSIYCDTSPDQPAILTCASDDTVGEPLGVANPPPGSVTQTITVNNNTGMELSYYVADNQNNTVGSLENSDAGSVNVQCHHQSGRWIPVLGCGFRLLYQFCFLSDIGQWRGGD
jgi:hypothetical protein